jgi:hypothetical protein
MAGHVGSAVGQLRGSQVNNRFAAIAGLTVVLGGLTACSSSTTPKEQPATLLPGSARMTVDHHSSTTNDVTCTNVSQLLLIKAGSGAGFDAVVDRTGGLTAKSVSINDYGGFTGSYQDNLQGKAQVSKVDTTFTIAGAAVGFGADDPTARVTRDFTLDVVC